jgi:menaquinone-specific isochorismate synthase
MMGTDLAPHTRRSNLGWDETRLRAVLQERTPRGQGVMLSLPAAVVDGVTALRLAHTTPSFYWRPALPAATVVGWDAAALLTAQGPERFITVRDRARVILQSLSSASLDPDNGQLHDGGELVEPRLFGGFAFQPGATQHATWAGFDDANLVLPRWRYVVTNARDPGDERQAVLALTLLDAELHDDHVCEQWLQRLQQLHAALDDLALSPTGPNSIAPPQAVTQAEPTARADWDRQIQSILTAIQQRQCSKVVLARRSQKTFSKTLSLANTLAALQARSGSEITCFAFDFGQGVFLGATPETLINKVGSQLSSEALAGSVNSDDPNGESSLLESAKDREEHRVVVQAIVDVLKPLCSQIAFDEQPKIRRLRHLLHLWTPITAQLAAPSHVLDLVALLHPTPAVGGTPTDWAVRWITANETVPRGWYASPVGWFNAEGDGSFHVALRSGVLRGNDAYLYAGSGVVAKSDATAELGETELKLASLLDALRSD